MLEQLRAMLELHMNCTLAQDLHCAILKCGLSANSMHGESRLATIDDTNTMIFALWAAQPVVIRHMVAPQHCNFACTVATIH